MSRERPSLRASRSPGCSAGPADSGPSLGLSTLNTPLGIRFGKYLHYYKQSGAALCSLGSGNCCCGGQLARDSLVIASLTLTKPRLLILITYDLVIMPRIL